MASFGWKRKVGEKVSKSVVEQFEEAEKAPDDDSSRDESVDWQHAIKRRRELLLEDCAAQSRRLKDEGAVLAEGGRSGGVLWLHRVTVCVWMYSTKNTSFTLVIKFCAKNRTTM